MTMLEDNILMADPMPDNPTGPFVVFAGGGTAGHLYPALSVIDELRERVPDIRFAFFGTGKAIDKRVLSTAGYELVPQDVKPVTARPWRLPAFLWAWQRSMRKCLRYFKARRPAVVIGTGGFASGPAVCQAAKMRIPTALLNPDLIPGRANRFLASRVDCVFSQWSGTAGHFPAGVKVEVTGCPIRSDFMMTDRQAGYRRFALSPQRKTLLVTGASLGAHSINEAFVDLAADLARLDGWQVLHLTGENDLQRVQSAYERAGMAAVCLAYTDWMPDAMAMADLVVSRAGASTLAEITAMGKPSILLPYPHHRDKHQLANAETVAVHGAARICNDPIDGRRTAEALRADLFDLLTDDRALKEATNNATRLGKPHAASTVANRVVEMLKATAGRTHGGKVSQR